MSVGVWGMDVTVRLYDMTVVVYMRMRLVRSPAEKTPDLVRSHIRYDFLTLVKFKFYIFDIVSLHDREHHFLVDSKGYVHVCPLDHGRPVLIANGMAQLHTYADNILGRKRAELRQVDVEHGIELEAKYNSCGCLRIKSNNIAIYYLALPAQRHRILGAADTTPQKTAFLSCPLVEIDLVDVHIFQFNTPFGRMNIA